MKSIALFLMNEKGFMVLKSLINASVNIEVVFCSKDERVKNDYYIQIKNLCVLNQINFKNRNENVLIKSKFRFAIGWKWMIQDTSNLIILHDSILPKYRGFAPLVNSLINGEKSIGVTAIYANKEYDKGEIIDQIKIGIEYPIKIDAAIKKVSIIYSDLIMEIIKRIKLNSLDSIPQDETMASYSIWRDEEDYFINWNWSSEKISRFIDALGYPFNGARCLLNNQVLKINESEIINDVEIENRDVGKVINFKDKCPVVICGKGLLKLSDIETLTEEKIKINKFRSRFK